LQAAIIAFAVVAVSYVLSRLILRGRER